MKCRWAPDHRMHAEAVEELGTELALLGVPASERDSWHVYIYIYIYVHTHIHIHIHVYISVYIYIYIYIYIIMSYHMIPVSWHSMA